MHPGPSRRSRTSQAPGAHSQGEYACGGTPLAICAAAMASRHSHTVLPHPAAEFSWLACFASQSPLHGCAMLSPLCTRGAAECLRWHTALPRWAIEPRPVVCWASLSPGKHNRPFPRHWARAASRPLPVLARQHRSTGANSAYSLQRILAVPTRDRERSMGPASRWPRLGREKGRGKT